MKQIILLFLTAVYAFSFSVILNGGEEQGSSYSVLHIQNDTPFSCEAKLLELDKKIYICNISTKEIFNIDDKITSLVDIKFNKTNNGYEIIINPKQNSRLLNVNENLFGNNEIKKKNVGVSTHYSIIIDPTLREFKKVRNGINFPITYNDMIYPSIGALDINKMPIQYVNGDDIELYLNIKKLYDMGLYERVFDETLNASKIHPNSIFTSEFELYKIRALDKILSSQKVYDNFKFIDIVNMGKNWIRSFPSDENYPEVLGIILRAYLALDMGGDASYNLDILVKEHTNSKWTKLAIIDYAGAIYKEGKSKEAIKMLESVLYSSNDMEVASEAAFKLTDISIERAKFNDAKEYILKIINANKEYLLKDKNTLASFAQNFFNKKIYDISSKLYELYVENSKRSDDYYESALKNLGISLMRLGEVKKAYEYLKRYEKEFKDGAYVKDVEEALDELFFEINETNTTKLSGYYDTLMDRYGSNDIGKKALLEQIKLLSKDKKYDEILSYKNKVIDANDTNLTNLLNNTALILANESLVKSACEKTVYLNENFDIQNSINNQFRLFDCMIQMSRYDKAYSLAHSHINTKNLEDRVEWLIRVSISLYKLGKYYEAVNASNDAIAVAASLEYSDITPSLYYRFLSLLKLNRFDEAIQTINEFEKLKKDDVKLLEMYDKIAKFAAKKDNDSVVLTYSKKAIDMQKRLNLTLFSPGINFLYISSLNKISDYKNAINAGRELLAMRLEPSDRLRALYQTAEVCIKIKNYDEAKKYVDECINSTFNNSWKDLCVIQKEILSKSLN